MAWANGRVGAASGDRRCSLVTGLSTNRIMASAALSPHLAKEIATLAILFLPTEPLAQAVLRVPMSPEDLLGRDGSPSGPAPQTWRFRRNRPTPGARLSLASLWRGLHSCPEDLLGRDRSPSGPAPQTLALSEKSPYPRSCPDNAQPTMQLDRSSWLRLLLQECRCSLMTGIQSARASRSPRLAKESASPSRSSQWHRPS